MPKILLMTILFLSACSVGPDYQKKDVFEDQQIAENLKLKGTSLKISKKWYRDFNDENLNALIDAALSQNSDILISVERLKQARTATKIAKVEFLPTLGLSGGYDYAKASKNIGLAADTDYFLIGFDAAWEIDIWGKGRRINEQKKAEFESTYYSLQNIKNVITAEVASTYFTLKTLEEQRRIALENLKLQNDIFKNIEEKYSAGLATESDYRQSAYLLEKTKSLIPSLEEQIEAQKNALSVLTGQLAQSSDQNIQNNKNPINRAFNYNIKNLFDLPADIIRTRPDVKASEKALVAQNAAIGQAVANLYPNVSISALFGFQADNLSRLLNSNSKAYSYQPSAVLPLFEWNKLQNTVQLEREKFQESYQNYRKTLLSSIQELANAITGVQKAYLSNRALTNSAYNMQLAYRAMKEKYDNGLIEYNTLLQAQQDLLNVKTELAGSNGNIYQKLIAFYKATGGGYND
ncbi:MAG: efflux transporter outer membrane subunit [Alphaproteobacteria bacterium]|nr:efflux transporter outer membrane subunit [Alphaproteobacteria bacterium]